MSSYHTYSNFKLQRAFRARLVKVEFTLLPTLHFSLGTQLHQPIFPVPPVRMVKNQLSIEQKSRALTLLEEGASVIREAAELGVTRMTIYRLKKAGDTHPSGTTPQLKKSSGRPKKTSSHTDLILKKEVKVDPGITALELKKKYPILLQDVAMRTVQHRLQKDLKLPLRQAAKKPLLTDTMRKKGLQFCKKYRFWTSLDWKKVMFSDESTFRLVRGTSKLVRRPRGASRYDPKYCQTS